MKYNSAIIAMFKNESMVIKEWIEHYKWQGIGHIYLINNDSSDNFLPIIQPFINEGYITLYDLPEPYQQEKNYNIVFDEVRNDMEWIISVDIDEYWFGTKCTLDEYLLNVNPKYDNILIDWEMFGSSGYDKQPTEIRKSFIKRKDVPGLRSVIDEGAWWKVISRSSEVGRLCLHLNRHITEKNREWDPNIPSPWTQIHNDFENVRLFHYQVMSKEYWENVKMVRGDAWMNELNDSRNWKIFNERDFNEVTDTTLSNLIKYGY